MSERPALRARAMILSTPWAMTPEMVRTMLAIAERENLSPEAVAAQLGRPLDNTRAVTVRDGVAVIPVEGPIARRLDLFTAVSGGVAIETLATDLAAALASPQVHSILLAIDSPGGEVGGVAEFAAMVRAAHERKPVTAYVGGLGASAAYWIAAAAGEVVAASTALVGSIGVVLAVPDPDKSSARSIEFVSSQSPHKRPDPRTEGGRGRLQALVDDLAALFIGAVAGYRDLAEEAVAAIGGGLLVGQRAVDAGLADRLGSFEGVVAELSDAAAERRGAAGGWRMAAAAEEGTVAKQGFWATFFGGLGQQMDAEQGFTPAALASAEPVYVPQGAAIVAPTAPTCADPPVAATPPDPEVAALRAQLAALREERQREAEERLAGDAAAFADGEIAASRAFPAERAALVGAYLDAARDDAALGPIASADPEGAAETRVARLRARSALRPAHTLTTEAVPTREAAAVLANVLTTQFGPDDAQPEGPLSEAERDRLLALTPTGRAVLEERRRAAQG